ncbi:MAG: chemotaxis protein CheA [Phycisphaerae bacterium]
MDNLGVGVDPQLRGEFIDESLEGLARLARLYVDLEGDPTNVETIGAIFRVAHSIKGSAAFFELMQIKTMSHVVESLLDAARQGRLVATPAIISALLAGTDELVEMFNRAREGHPEIVDQEHFDRLVARLTAATNGEGANLDAVWAELLETLEACRAARSIPLDVLESGVGQAADLAAQLATALGVGKQVEVPGSYDTLPEPGRCLHELLGAMGDSTPDDDKTAAIGRCIADLKDAVSSEDALAAVEEARSSFESVRDTIGPDPLLVEIGRSLIETLVKLEVEGPNKKEAAPASDAPDASREPTPAAGSTAKEEAQQVVRKTMRVTEDSVDGFLAFVGELVVISEMYRNFLGQMLNQTACPDELQRINATLDELSSNLQNSIMDIRRVPMQMILQRAPRIVRDVANAAGKEIKTVVEGESILLDKSIVDTLEAPLIHMVRNSADHGIETPDVREAAGKDRCGFIEIIGAETSHHVTLTVKDDGKGLDYDALAEKAVALGLFGPDHRPSEAEIIDILFASGVSTAEKVTDVSGRGVGMDVVKRNIESMGGKITVTSEPGAGSEFCIQLPKTVSTQILSGFVVSVGGQRYVVPADKLVECIRPEADQIRTCMGGGNKVIVHGDALLPICAFPSTEKAKRDGDSFDVKPPGAGDMVIVETEGQSVALCVDRLEGFTQVVVKNTGFLNIPGFQGAAVMGDQSVALILDVDPFLQRALASNVSADQIEAALRPIEPNREIGGGCLVG